MSLVSQETVTAEGILAEKVKQAKAKHRPLQIQFEKALGLLLARLPDDRARLIAPCGYASSDWLYKDSGTFWRFDGVWGTKAMFSHDCEAHTSEDQTVKERSIPLAAFTDTEQWLTLAALRPDDEFLKD